MSRRDRRRRYPPQTDGERRTPAAGWVLLGLLLGLAGALYYAWIVDPIVYTEAGPARLGEPYQEEYIFLVSQSYAADGDWERAQQRLAALDDPALGETVNRLLEQYLREQRPPTEIRNLANLARELGVEGSAVALFAPTPLSGLPTATATPTLPPEPTNTPTVTPTPSPTSTPFPTPTNTAVPSPTAQPIYRLVSQDRVCEDGEPAPRIEVVTLDALLNQLPGVEVNVSWDGGADNFFTGFKPEIGPGYGDFTMRPGLSYSVILPEGSPEISGLRVEPCDSGLDGGWRLTFQNLQRTVEIEETPES